MSEILERGDIYFLYRPKVEEEDVESLDDVQRFFLVLSPREKPVFRRLIVGKKRLPDPERGERFWGRVERVAERPRDLKEDLEPATYQTRTRGERHQPGARPAGEGVYALVRHGDHVHLAYALELPKQPGEVQEELRIEPQASYVLTVRNPEAPKRPGLPHAEPEPSYPSRKQERFGERRFAEGEPDLLQEGAQFILIGAHEEPEEQLGVELPAEDESAQSADLFQDLQLDRRQHPVRPLFEGAWS